MREIKFRTWDKENKVMYKSFQLSQYMSYNEGAQERLAPSSKQNTVLMQYTGLKDKNGVGIYEGDIVRGICSDVPERVCEGLKQSDLMGKPVKGFIDYSSTYAQFRFTTDEITYLAFPFGILEPEVIGNIYENPELLNA